MKASFFVVSFQLSDLQRIRGEGFTSPFPSPFVHLVLLSADLPPRPRLRSAQWSPSHFVSHEMCIVHKLPRPSVKARVKEKWG